MKGNKRSNTCQKREARQNFAEPIRIRDSISEKQRSTPKGVLLLGRVDKKDALLIFIVFSYFTQNYDMHNNSCQYKRYAASI